MSNLRAANKTVILRPKGPSHGDGLRPQNDGILLLITFGVLLSFACLPVAYANDPFVKLGRGLTNIVTSPFEILVQSIEVKKSHDHFTSLVAGPLRGIVVAGRRILTGAYEVVTFPLPIPKGYEPLWEPATIFEALEEKDY